MIVSMFLSLPHCSLDIFATGTHVNRGGKYGLEIPANFYFYGSEKANWLKNKDWRNLKQNRKTLSKVKMPYMTCHWVCVL